MRRVIVSNHVTLDGRVDAPRDWAVPFNDEEFVKCQTELLSHSDGLLLGRHSYEFFAAVSPSRSGTFRYVDQMNSMVKYMASTTLKDPGWENTHLIEGDVPEAVARLKQQPGQDLVMYGSHDLMHILVQHDLIDEHRLWVYPVVLGKGRSLFTEGVRIAVELVNTAVLSSGVVSLTYRSKRRTGLRGSELKTVSSTRSFA